MSWMHVQHVKVFLTILNSNITGVGVCGEAYLILDAALISFMAALTRWSGSMSVTRVWMIMNPKVLMLLVSWSFTS